jgi:chromosome segregation ATPase
MDTHQDQKHEIDLLRRQLEEMRQDLNDARDGWENSAEAMREAIDALDLAERVQAQLVDAAQAAEAVLDRQKWIDHTAPEAIALAKLRAALTVAGITA